MSSTHCWGYRDSPGDFPQPRLCFGRGAVLGASPQSNLFLWEAYSQLAQQGKQRCLWLWETPQLSSRFSHSPSTRGLFLQESVWNPVDLFTLHSSPLSSFSSERGLAVEWEFPLVHILTALHGALLCRKASKFRLLMFQEKVLKIQGYACWGGAVLLLKEAVLPRLFLTMNFTNLI